MDSILGNIGAPLRVGDEDEENDHIAEEDEETRGMPLDRTQTSISEARELEEPETATPMDDRITDGAERIIAVLGGGDEEASHTQAGGELQV